MLLLISGAYRPVQMFRNMLGQNMNQNLTSFLPTQHSHAALGGMARVAQAAHCFGSLVSQHVAEHFHGAVLAMPFTSGTKKIRRERVLLLK